MPSDAVRHEIAEVLEMRFDAQPDAALVAADRILAIPEIAEALRAKDELDDRESWARGDPI